MVGLVPAIHGGVATLQAADNIARCARLEFYIMTNRPNGILYLGVTAYLRIASGSTAKGWWKVRLILKANPGWTDLYDQLL
jgi:hypothetical protein